MAVVKSKGDGYSLYGGTKLANIPLGYEEGSSAIFLMDTFYLLIQHYRNDPIFVYYDELDNFVMVDADYYDDRTKFYAKDVIDDDNWVELSYDDAYDILSNTPAVPIWVKARGFGIYDETIDKVILTASEPIPLDGYDLIEWDGDTEGLWDNGDGTYHICDYFPVTNALAVYGDEICTELYGGNKDWSVCGEEVSDVAYAYTSLSSNGIVDFRKEDDEHYTSLLAYIPIASKTITITYHSEHGTAPEPKEVEVEGIGEYNINEYDLPTLTADGYIFKGWSTYENGDVITGIIVGEDTDLYAVWEKATVDYTITYETAHGTAPTSKTVTVNEGESYTLTEADLPTLSAEGYVFKGWSMSVGDTINADTVLTAIWDKDTVDYTISYSTAHGTAPSSKNVVVYYGESYKLAAIDLPTLSVDGFLFGGWSVNGQIVSVGHEITADTTLTAVWVENLPVSKIDHTSMMLGWIIGSRIKL